MRPGNLVPELGRYVIDNHCIIESLTYPKRLSQISATVEFGGKKTLKNSFVPVSATSEVLRKLLATKILLLFGVVTQNSASADEIALVQYLKCTEPL